MATERRLGYVKMDCLGYSIPHVCQTIQSVNKQMSSSTPVHVAYTYVAGLSVVNGLCVECVWCVCSCVLCACVECVFVCVVCVQLCVMCMCGVCVCVCGVCVCVCGVWSVCLCVVCVQLCVYVCYVHVCSVVWTCA